MFQFHIWILANERLLQRVSEGINTFSSFVLSQKADSLHSSVEQRLHLAVNTFKTHI